MLISSSEKLREARPPSNVSMTIMRPPQHGLGCAKTTARRPSDYRLRPPNLVPFVQSSGRRYMQRAGTAARDPGCVKTRVWPENGLTQNEFSRLAAL
jgi:hypothetical protein